MKRLAAMLCGAALVAMAAPARADDVGDEITLIEKQPAGVDLR